MLNISLIIGELKNELQNCKDLDSVDQIRIKYLGKNGLITQHLQNLTSLPHEARKAHGQTLNSLKVQASLLVQEKHDHIALQILNQKLLTETIDISLPPRESSRGSIHPISHVIKEMLMIFNNMGFSLEEGPEIEDEYHNFTALNVPEHHPARDMHDTFYMSPIKGKNELKHLLRTHTSNVQIRSMMNKRPPFKFISFGRVYRCDSDATHSPMFHQLEGVYIDKNVNMTHLKGCLQQFLDTFFCEQDIKIRMRPSFFPFTEPSAEIDISINNSEWLEVLGCGMIHENVLKEININPQEFQGFAFGIGIDRFTMLKYGIKDLRTFFEGDLRWSNKYGFNFYD